MSPSTNRMDEKEEQEAVAAEEALLDEDNDFVGAKLVVRDNNIFRCCVMIAIPVAIIVIFIILRF